MIRVILGIAAVCVCRADDRVRVDNDSVRVLKAVQQPHQPTALHEHVFNRVMIYLDGGTLEVRHQNGRVEKQTFKPGEVAWSTAGGMHVSENVGAVPVTVVEIELKKPGPKLPASRPHEFDPVAIDPKHNVFLFENDQVRVFRSWREPGGTEKMHEHLGAGRVAVLLTDLDARVKGADGGIATSKGAAGDVLWSAPTRHASTNVG